MVVSAIVYVGMGTSTLSPCIVSIIITREGCGLGGVLGEVERVKEECLTSCCFLIYKHS